MKLSQHLLFKKKKKNAAQIWPFRELSFRETWSHWDCCWVDCLCFSPSILECPGRVTAEMSLRLMIMNYAEGHILLVTSHLHGLPLDCLAWFNVIFLLLGNNSLNRCSKLNLLTFYFSSIMPSLQNNQIKKKKKKTKTIYPQWNYNSNKSWFIFSPLVCQSGSYFKGLPVLISHPLLSSSIFTEIEKIV